MIAGRRGNRATWPAFAALSLAWVACSPGSPDAGDPFHGPPRVVVHARSTMPGSDVLSRGMAHEVAHWLEYAPDVIVRPVRSGSGGARDVAETADASHVVTVEVQQGNTGVVVGWRLMDADGRGRGRDEFSVLWDSLPTVPRRVTTEVSRGLGVGDDPEGRGGLAALATDPRAYRDFLRILGGEEGAEADREAELAARIAALESVTTRLARYVPALTQLGADYLDLAGLVGGTGPYYDRADETLARAFELQRDYPATREKRAALFAKTGRAEEAVALLREGLEAHPYYPPYHERLGYVLRYAGLMDASMVRYREGQRLDGTPTHLVSTQDQITKSLIYLGEYDAALASHRQMMTHLDDAGREPDEKQRFYEGVIQLYRADVDAAVAAFQEGARLLPESVWTTFGTAYRAMALGDTSAVRGVLTDLEARRVVDGERRYRLVHFAAFAGATDRALDHLQAAIDGGFFNAPYFETDPWVDGLRTSPRFAMLVARARARHEAVARALGSEAPG